MADDLSLKIILQDESGSNRSDSGQQETLAALQAMGAIPPSDASPASTGPSIPEPLSRFYKRYPHKLPTPEAPPIQPNDPLQQLKREAEERAARHAQEREELANRPQAPPGLSDIAPGIAGAFIQNSGSIVGGVVGASTGSGTAGALAGSVAQAGAQALASAGPVGIAIGALVVGGTILGESFRALSNSAKSLAEQLKGTSGPIAAAEAKAQTAQILKSIEIGQQLGTELSAFIAQETEFNIAFRQLQADVMKKLLPTITDILDVATVIAQAVDGTFKSLVQIYDVAQSTINGPVLGFYERQKFRDFLEEQQKLKANQLDQKVKDFLDPAKVAKTAPFHPFPNRLPAPGRKGIF